MSKYLNGRGFFIADAIFEQDPQPFIFILGGRGIGKTYSATRWLCENSSENEKFIFMRRTENEIKMINTGNIYYEHSPEIVLNTKGRIAKVLRGEKEEIIGYHLALSTIHNIRGFSMLDVSYILFDEFIAERGTVLRKFAGEQMLNGYETINRNRELEGRPPVKCVFLSNYNTAESDIMQAFGFSDEIYKLSLARPIGIMEDDIKKLIMINDAPISKEKEKTALYRATNNSDFRNMSLKNDGSVFLMPEAHYGRNSYEYLGSLGMVNINRLYSGFFYLTERRDDITEPSKKDILTFSGVYMAYRFGNVYTQNQYIAQKFIAYFDL